MKLIIVESPTKAKTLGKFLGDGYDVMATMGHIKDLPKSTLGVDVDHDFKPEFIDVPKRLDTIKSLKSLAKKADAIYLASDPDREGEAIAQHVADVLRSNGKSQMTNDKLKRISFHEITKEAVQEALDNPRQVDANLVDAQTARRVLDRLVGYKLSPLLWKKVRVGLSAGRVQTVAVRLIVEKEREIEKFKSDEYWEIFAEVKQLISNSIKTVKTFTVQLIKQDIKNKEVADKVIGDLNGAIYKVLDVRKKEVSKIPYPPFTTSTMTQSAARVMGWTSKKTMSVAQKLYEEGLITYHRTDSLNLSIPAVEKVRDYIKKEFGENYLPSSPRLYKTKSKVAQEAHEAIRPTDVNTKYVVTPAKRGQAEEKFSGEGEKLYNLIWKRFVASQMNPSVYDETAIDVSATVHGSQLTADYLLRAGGQVMKFDGWRRVMPLKKDDEEVIAILPEVSNGDALDKEKVWGDQKFTLAPARFNEASLIKTLEKLGIGRPSTYAPTISVIQIRNYVEKKDGKFFPTTVGIAVNDFLIANFPDVFEYAFTAGMENSLDDIANGKLKWEREIGKFWKPFDKKLADVTKNSVRVKIEVEKLGKPCPDCGSLPAGRQGELVIRTGRFGKFISCSRFPECKHTEKFLQKIGVICPDCVQKGLPVGRQGDVIIKKTGKGRQFFGCSRYPDCKYASWKNPKPQSDAPSVESSN